MRKLTNSDVYRKRMRQLFCFMTFYAVFRPKISCGQVDTTFVEATDVNTASCGWMNVCVGGWMDGSRDRWIRCRWIDGYPAGGYQHNNGGLMSI